MSSGIEEIKYVGNRKESVVSENLVAALGKPSKEKQSFIPEVTKHWGNLQKLMTTKNDYGFNSFAMTMPESTTTYMSAASIK